MICLIHEMMYKMNIYILYIYIYIVIDDKVTDREPEVCIVQ